MKTKLLHFFFLAVFFLPHLSSAQYQWLQNGGGINTLNGSNYFSKEQVIDMATDSQRNIYVLSVISKNDVNVSNNPSILVTTYEQNPNSPDFILISYTCDGSYRWHKVFGGGGYDYASGIQIDSQDNVYVSGRQTQCSDNNGSDPYYSIPRIGNNDGVDYTFNTTLNSCLQMFLAKFNNNGVFQWIHFPHNPLASTETGNIRIMRNFYIVNDVIHWIVQLTPGSYENGAFSNTNTTVPFLYYVLKYDTSGTFVSATPFDLQISFYTNAELRWYRNPFNGYYYAVYLNNNTITVTAGGNTLNPDLPKIICFNDQGQYLWHSESTGYTLNFQTLDFDPQNNIYVSGTSINYTSLSNSFLGWSLPGTNTGAATFIMKCNPTMSAYDWVTNMNPGASRVASVLYTSSKIYAASSFGDSPFVWDTQTITGPGVNNGTDPLLAAFDSNTGNCTSLHRLVGNNGVDDGFTKIIQDNNGDLILGGYMGYQLTDSNGTDYYSYGGNTDFFITKFASAACTPLSNESFEKAALYLYPNPANNYVTVAISENVNYELYSLTGQLIKSGSLTVNKNTINLQELSKGCYLLKLTNNNNIMQTVKVLKE